MLEDEIQANVVETERDKIGYWLRWIKAAKKGAYRHWQDSRAAYREYELEDLSESEKETRQTPKGNNIYAESCWTLETAYYSKTPKVVSKRRYGVEDELALTMSLIVERLGQNLVDNSCIDDAMLGSTKDLIHASKASIQLIYELDATGNKKLFLAPLLFDEVLHTPNAKTEIEIKEKAYKFYLSYDEAEAKFNTSPEGEKLGRKLPYKIAKDYESKNDDDIVNNPGKQLEGWEIWDLTTKRVYWVAEDFTSDFLIPPAEDPYKLAKFFPSTPFKIKNKKRKTLYPKPTYNYLESTINMLHLLYYRIFDLVDAVRRRALVYGASPEIIKALNDIDGQEYISVSDAADLLEKGGINKMIEWIEVSDLVQAISESLNLEQHFRDRFNEAFGIPDILRGISDPEETAAAQQIKSDAGHDRFKTDKKFIVDMAKEGTEMLLDLALQVLDDNEIKRICAWEFMERGDPGTPPTPPTPENPQGNPGTPPKPSHYERFDEALMRLRNDKDRLVTIDFETDSTSFRDEGKEIQKAQIIAATVKDGLAAIGNAQNPEFIPLALDILLGTLEMMGGSTKLENMIKRAVSALEKIKSQPTPPPPPDPQEIKNQIAMQQQQIDQAIAGRELQQRDLELQLKQQQQFADQRVAEIETSLKQQIEGMRIALQDKQAEIANAKRIDQAQEAAANVQAKERELDVKTAMLQRDNEIAQLKLVNERQINEMFASLEQQRIANDSLRVKHEEILSKLRIMESFMEEQRLGKQQSIDNAMTMIDTASNIGG